MGPLEKLKVIEFSGIGPGPFCGMMLADMGADVIRIDRPLDQPPKSGTVETFQTGKFDILNRGKRLLRLDLKSDADRKVVEQLISGADALIEGFRPGVMERLGLGPDACLAMNERLVYGRVTGWGQEGAYSRSAGHDINFIALNGVLDMIGNPGVKPAIPPTLVGDMGGGAMFLLAGVLAAVLSVRETGKGQIVDAAIVDGSAVLSALVWSFAGNSGWGPRGTNLIDGGPHFYDTYLCADGKYLSVGAIEPQFYEALLKGLGLESEEDFQDQMKADMWPILKARLAGIFATSPREHWVAVFSATDACVWPVLDREEVLRHPEIISRGVYVEHDGVVQPAPAPRFSLTQGEISSLAGQNVITADQAMDRWCVSER